MCVCVCACVCDSFKKHSSRTAPLCNPHIEQRTLRHLLTSRNFCLRPSLSSATGRLGSDPLAGELVGCLCFVDAGRSHAVVGQRRGALLLAVQQAACWHLFPSPPKSQWMGRVGPDWLRHSAQSTLSHRRGPLSRGSVDLLARTSALCSRRRHGLFLPRPLAQQTALTCHYAWGQSVSPHTDMQDHQRPWGFLPASLILHLP